MAKRPTEPLPEAANLSPDQKAAAIPKLEKRLKELEALDPNTVTSWDNAAVKALEIAIDRTLMNVFGHNTVEYNRFRTSSKIHRAPIYFGRSASPQEHVQGTTRGKSDAIATLQEIIRGFREDLEEFPASIANSTPERSDAPPSRRIFIVHGHDEAAREALARFLERIDLEPIILHEQVSQGRTVIEKIEEHSSVGFAVVLLTPDDVGAPVADRDKLRSRPRQNVIFELGFFIALLGRARVCALTKGELEVLSDFAGVIYTPMDPAGGWKIALAKEIDAAGVTIDFNKVMRA